MVVSDLRQTALSLLLRARTRGQGPNSAIGRMGHKDEAKVHEVIDRNVDLIAGHLQCAGDVVSYFGLLRLRYHLVRPLAAALLRQVDPFSSLPR